MLALGVIVDRREWRRDPLDPIRRPDKARPCFVLADAGPVAVAARKQGKAVSVLPVCPTLADATRLCGFLRIVAAPIETTMEDAAALARRTRCAGRLELAGWTPDGRPDWTSPDLSRSEPIRVRRDRKPRDVPE